MPLLPNALQVMRANLEIAAQWFDQSLPKPRPKPPIVVIGNLSAAQVEQINRQRSEEADLPPIVGEVVFDGRHLYESRCIDDGYTIDEVLEIVAMSFQDSSVVGPGWSTVLRSVTTRLNSEGRTIRDEAVFECHGWTRPRPELRSVIPRGDGKDHTRDKKRATR